MEAVCDRLGSCGVIAERARDKVRDSPAERVARRVEASIDESVGSEEYVGGAKREYSGGLRRKRCAQR